MELRGVIPMHDSEVREVESWFENSPNVHWGLIARALKQSISCFENKFLVHWKKFSMLTYLIYKPF